MNSCVLLGERSLKRLLVKRLGNINATDTRPTVRTNANEAAVSAVISCEQEGSVLSGPRSLL